MGGFGMLSRSRCVRRPLGGQIDSDNGRCSNSFEHHKKSSAPLKDAELFSSTEPMRSIPSRGSRSSQPHPIDRGVHQKILQYALLVKLGDFFWGVANLGQNLSRVLAPLWGSGHDVGRCTTQDCRLGNKTFLFTLLVIHHLRDV